MFIIKRGGVKEVKKDGNVARYILYDYWCLEINSNIVPSFRNWAGVSSRIKWGRKCVCVCVFTARSYAHVVDGGGQVIVTVWTDLTHVCISYSACHHADITCDNRSFFFSSPCSISTLRSSTGMMFYVWLGTKRAGWHSQNSQVEPQLKAGFTIMVRTVVSHAKNGWIYGWMKAVEF